MASRLAPSAAPVMAPSASSYKYMASIVAPTSSLATAAATPVAPRLFAPITAAALVAQTVSTDARAVVWSVLKSVVEEGIDKIGDDANLLDAGLDSLGLAEVALQLEEKFGTNAITVDDILGAPTVAAIASRLAPSSAAAEPPLPAPASSAQFVAPAPAPTVLPLSRPPPPPRAGSPDTITEATAMAPLVAACARAAAERTFELPAGGDSAERQARRVLFSPCLSSG